jgi:hypothetical protein
MRAEGVRHGGAWLLRLFAYGGWLRNATSKGNLAETASDLFSPQPPPERND